MQLIMVSPRYSRQICLPEIGEKGQEVLKKSRVLVIGAGGLGSPAALYLAAAGVGELGLIDPDRVDLSNLQRQILFRTDQQGALKVDAAKAALVALNPEIKIKAWPEKLTPDNAREIAGHYDVLLDGTDNFPSKFLIGDIAQALGIPLIHGTVTGFEGRVTVFPGKDGPCFRCVHPKIPETRIANCAESGVLGAVTGVIGSIQAIETIKLLLGGNSRSLSGRMLVFEAWQMEARVFDIQQNPDCSFCALNKTAFDPKRPEYQSKSACAHKSQDHPAFNLSPEDLAHIPHYVLVDIRELSEWDQGRIPGARHWPLASVIAGAHAFEPALHYVLYCRSGVRSASALEFLHDQGIKNVSHLREGILGWRGPLDRN
ncbi:MAG: hypothetical protein A2X94_07265 [Bdellovibrionales bacterium GWB1_55_8]|nr:MAG: hypothetical protein A2X94_07265 [Bdellovibrionales bacterium GWB1_55_8]